MRLFNCYHPRVVTNKYTGQQVSVACGKCPACLNARAADWVTRLDQESLQHRYTFFVTLQFDEQHVKQLSLLAPLDRPNNLPAYIDISTGQIICLSDVSSFNQADINYCENTQILLVHDVSLFQNFIKRLRKYIYENYGNERIRFYTALEYGPTSFRPHCHSLFFFDSSLLAKDFGELLSRSWQYGSVFDPHTLSGSASQYVAAYVNSTSNLPAIYSHKEIRQRALFSKRPPIGSFAWSEETFKRFFDSPLDGMSLFNKRTSSFLNVPLWRSLQHRLFPRIVGFDRLSFNDRIALYGLGFRFIEACEIGQQFTKAELLEVNLMYLSNFLSRPYWSNVRDLFVTKSKFAHSKYYILNEDSLKRFIYSVSDVCRRCLSWNISLVDYVKKIDSYYEDLKRKRLADYYYLQDEYFKSHPISEFLCLFPDFCLSVYNKRPSQLEAWQVFYINEYAPNLLLCDKPIFIDYKNCDAYKSLKGLHDKIAFDNTKQKKSNDYLLTHKDKFLNIITYNQEIENYVSSKIV